MCNIEFPYKYSTVSTFDKYFTMGVCTRCNGRLTIDHKCHDIYAEELAQKIKKAHEDAGKSTLIFGGDTK